jgi:hypothetical protein
MVYGHAESCFLLCGSHCGTRRTMSEGVSFIYYILMYMPTSNRSHDNSCHTSSKVSIVPLKQKPDSRNFRSSYIPLAISHTCRLELSAIHIHKLLDIVDAISNILILRLINPVSSIFVLPPYDLHAQRLQTVP